MKTFCCGCTLKTGCLIIGYFYSIACFLSFGYCILGGIVLAIHEDDERYLFFAISFLILKSFCVNVLFLVGVHKGRAALILPWLIWIVFKLIIESFAGVFVAYIASRNQPDMLFPLLFCSLAGFALEIYLVLVATHFYHSLRKKSSLLDEEHLAM